MGNQPSRPKPTNQPSRRKPKVYRVPIPEAIIALDLSVNSQSPEGNAKRLLLSTHKADRIIALHGIGGTGKTTILYALGADEDVQAFFSDAIWFVQLGKDATLDDLVEGLVRFMTELLPESDIDCIKVLLSKPRTHVDAAERLVDSFRSMKVLLIFDDVWDTDRVLYSLISQIARYLQSSARNSKLLISTRDRRVARTPVQAKQVHVDARDATGAVSCAIVCHYAYGGQSQSFPRHASSANKIAFIGILNKCGGLPLALAVAGGGVNEFRNGCDTFALLNPEDSWNAYWEVVKHNVNEIGLMGTDDHREALFPCILVGLEILDTRWGKDWGISPRDVFESLCVLEKQTEFPVDLLMGMWDVDLGQAISILARLSGSSLLYQVRRNGVTEAVRMHHLIHDCSVTTAQEGRGKAHWHSKIVSWYKKDMFGQSKSHHFWPEAVTGIYGTRNLMRHLLGADNVNNALEIVADFRWIQKLFAERCDWVRKLSRDFQFVSEYVRNSRKGSKQMRIDVQREIDFIIESLGMCESQADRERDHEYYGNDDEGLASWMFQLYGRMAGFRDPFGLLSRLVWSMETYGPRPWTRPMIGMLRTASGLLKAEFELSLPPDVHVAELLAASDAGDEIVINCKSSRSLRGVSKYAPIRSRRLSISAGLYLPKTSPVEGVFCCCIRDSSYRFVPGKSSDFCARIAPQIDGGSSDIVFCSVTGKVVVCSQGSETNEFDPFVSQRDQLMHMESSCGGRSQDERAGDIGMNYLIVDRTQRISGMEAARTTNSQAITDMDSVRLGELPIVEDIFEGSTHISDGDEHSRLNEGPRRKFHGTVERLVSGSRKHGSSLRSYERSEDSDGTYSRSLSIRKSFPSASEGGSNLTGQDANSGTMDFRAKRSEGEISADSITHYPSPGGFVPGLGIAKIEQVESIPGKNMIAVWGRLRNAVLTSLMSLDTGSTFDLLPPVEDPEFSCIFKASADGSFLVILTESAIQRWDVSTSGEAKFKWNTTLKWEEPWKLYCRGEGLETLQVQANSSVVVIIMTRKGVATVLDANCGTVKLQRMVASWRKVKRFALTEDGGHVILACSFARWKKKIFIWKLISDTIIDNEMVISEDLCFLCKHGREMLSVTSSGTIRVWDLDLHASDALTSTGGELNPLFSRFATLGFAVSENESCIATVHSDNFVRIWNCSGVEGGLSLRHEIEIPPAIVSALRSLKTDRSPPLGGVSENGNNDSFGERYGKLFWQSEATQVAVSENGNNIAFCESYGHCKVGFLWSSELLESRVMATGNENWRTFRLPRRVMDEGSSFIIKLSSHGDSDFLKLFYDKPFLSSRWQGRRTWYVGPCKGFCPSDIRSPPATASSSDDASREYLRVVSGTSIFLYCKLRDDWIFMGNSDFEVIDSAYIPSSGRLWVLLSNGKLSFIDEVSKDTPRPPLPPPKILKLEDPATNGGVSEKPRDWVYDVFISHSGHDKLTMAIPLREKLKGLGITSFVDKVELRTGDIAPEAMIEAMESSPVGVFILSPDFVAKHWTMKELRCFLERRDGGNGTHLKSPKLIPVFYRLGIYECEDRSFLFESEEEGMPIFEKYGFFKRAEEGELSIAQLMQCMKEVKITTGIINVENASNEDSEIQEERRERLLERIAREVVEVLERLDIRKTK